MVSNIDMEDTAQDEMTTVVEDKIAEITDVSELKKNNMSEEIPVPEQEETNGNSEQADSVVDQPNDQCKEGKNDDETVVAADQDEATTTAPEPSPQPIDNTNSPKTEPNAVPAAESAGTETAEAPAVAAEQEAAAVTKATTPVTNGDENKDDTKKPDEALGATVAKHYNEIPAGSKETRKESRIFHLRNFNNWAKSTMISEFLDKIKRHKRTSDDVVVLDLACGKGGDLLKWQKGKVDHVFMADIASTSIDQCKERYARLEKESKHSRYRDRLFTMEAYAVDCTKENLAEKYYKKKDAKIDLASCQFAFHYAFESLEQAETMVKNACERLNNGGYWIGTMPDANHIVKNVKKSEDGSFGNSVFTITPDSKEDFPLFGSKYMFHLEGVVDCPEFLVHFPVVEKLAEKHGMKLVWKKNFHDLYKYMEKDHASLLHRMSALETYPANSNKLLAAEEEEYSHAKDFMKENECSRVGTLSKDEWEAAGIYIAFAFEKTDKKEERKSAEKSSDRKHQSRDHRSRSGHRDSSSHRHSSAKRSRKETEETEFTVADEITCEDEDETTPTTEEPATKDPVAWAAAAAEPSIRTHARGALRAVRRGLYWRGSRAHRTG